MDPHDRARTRAFRRHAGAALIAAAADGAALGLFNGVGLLVASATWFASFAGDEGASSGTTRELLTQAPILFYAVAYDVAVCVAIAVPWALLVGARARLRGDFAPGRRELAAWHLSAFFWFPFFLVLLLGMRLRMAERDPRDPASLIGEAIFGAVLLLGLAWALHRLTRRVLLALGGLRPFRRLGSRRGLVGVAVTLGLTVTVAGFVPPLFAPPRPTLPVSSSPGPATADRPNVLLIVVDTLRADHLSLYGYERPTSPVLDAFARGATVYERAYSGGVWTVPGHASILTGRIPSRHGANGEGPALSREVATLPEALAKAGWSTAGFSNNPWIGPWTGLSRGLGRLDTLWRLSYNRQHTLGAMALQFTHWLRTKNLRGSGVIGTTEALLGWIDERDAGRPFFAFVNLMEPHIPLDYRDDYTSPFVPPGRRWRDVRSVQQRPYSLWAGTETLAAEDFEDYARMYDGEIRYLDEHLGALWDGLAARGLLDDTLVVLTSDHGQLIGDRGWLGHHLTVDEAVLHVPLVIWDPRARPLAGADGPVRVDEVVSTVDLFPTLLRRLELSDPALEAQLQGRALPTQPTGAPGFAVAEELLPLEVIAVLDKIPGAPVDAETEYDRRLQTVIRGDWKLVLRDGEVEALYDLATDPEETRDRAAEQPGIVAELHATLAAWLARHPPVEDVDESPVAMDPSTRMMLEALGYVDAGGGADEGEDRPVTRAPGP